MKPSRSIRRPTLIGVFIAILAVILIVAVQRGDQDRLPSDTSSPQDSSAEAVTRAPSISERSPRKSAREADRLLDAEGATTDVTLSSFPHREYQHLPAPSGKPAGAPVGEAYIHVPSAGRRVAMEPNQLGEFPAIETRLRDTVGVRIGLDSVKPGTPVRVVILDGGTFPSADGVSQVLKATDWRGVAFEYTTSGNIGTHRVLVQAAGQPSRILDFTAIAAKDS